MEMERNCLSNTLKDHGIRNRSYNYNNNNTASKLKDPWNHISQSYVGEDQDSCVGVGGFSWPPRSYTCSFCKREFRSAQALGGHMNVHRRDRARLRQSPPIMEINGQCPNPTTTSFNLNLLPNNCNPNPSNVSPPLTCTTLSSLVSSSSPFSALSSSSFASPREEEKWVSRKNAGSPLLIDPLSPKHSGFVKMGTRKSCLVAENLEGVKYQDGCKFLKKAEIVRLDLEIGVLGDHSKDDLDLELRLGYP